MSRDPILEVFSTPELISLIVASLSLRELLVTGIRISATFNNSILTDPHLLRKLFLLPSLDPKEPLEFNPLLQAAFPRHFESWSSRYFDSQDLLVYPLLRNPEIWGRKNATWKRMLLWNGGGPGSSRNVRLVSNVRQHLENTTESTSSAGIISTKDGLRMGAVWYLTKTICETNENGRFFFKWSKDALDVLQTLSSIEIELPIIMGGHRRRWKWGILCCPCFLLAYPFIATQETIKKFRNRKRERNFRRIGNNQELLHVTGSLQRREETDGESVRGGILDIWLSTSKGFDGKLGRLDLGIRSERPQREILTKYGEIDEASLKASAAAFLKQARKRRLLHG